MWGPGRRERSGLQRLTLGVRCSRAGRRDERAALFSGGPLAAFTWPQTVWAALTYQTQQAPDVQKLELQLLRENITTILITQYLCYLSPQFSTSDHCRMNYLTGQSLNAQ